MWWECPVGAEARRGTVPVEDIKDMPKCLGHRGVPPAMAMGCGTPYWTTQPREGGAEEAMGEKEQPERTRDVIEQARTQWGQSSNARQLMAGAKGPYPDYTHIEVEAEAAAAPSRPNVYTDGSVSRGGHGFWALAGSAAWWPTKDKPPKRARGQQRPVGCKAGWTRPLD